MARPPVYDEALRTKLVQCAAGAIAGSGLEGLSLRKVASCAGTSTSAIYALIGNRDQLINAVLGETIMSFLDSQAAVPVTEDPLEDMRNLGRAYRTWALSFPVRYALMFGPRLFGHGMGPSNFPELEGGVQLVADAYRRGVDRGLVVATADPVEVAILMWTFVHGFVTLETAQWTNIPVAERDALFEASLTAQSAYWLPACPEAS